MPTRPCTCPTSAPPSGRFNWSRRWRAGPAAGRRAAACWCRRSAPTIRPSRRPCGTTTRRLPPANCRSAQMLRYPPFASMIRLVVRGPVEPAAAEFAGTSGRAAARRRWKQRRPTPGCSARRPRPFARLRGMYRFQIQVQGADGEKLRAAVAQGHRRPRTARRRAVDRRRRSGGYAVEKEPIAILLEYLRHVESQ